MADIPDGIDQQTAKIALAWEMVKVTIGQDSASHSYKGEFGSASVNDRMKQLTKLFHQAYSGINHALGTDYSEEE